MNEFYYLSEEDLFVCRECGTTFNNEKELIRHLEELLHEKLTNYTDRQIVTTLLNNLDYQELSDLLNKLKEDWG